MMQQDEFVQHVGRENICPNVGSALDRAQSIMQEASLTSTAL
jgi:hypothetical protein